MEARGEKMNVLSGPSKEIAGLKKMKMEMMTPGSQDSPVWEFSHEALKDTLRLEDDYTEALKEGEVPAAYVRLMFLGAGGSGKSSLLDGLMSIKLRAAESTALADTKTVSFQWIKVADGAEDAWKEHTSTDETRSLAVHSHHLVQNKGSRIKGEGKSIKSLALAPAGDASGYLRQQVSREYSQNVYETKRSAYNEIIKEAKAQRFQPQNPDSPDVVMHVWDCGGQPVFLDVISAFLTPRTMFILLFDASISLDKFYNEKWHHNGKVIMGREQNITHLQLMMQWLQLIHSSLVANNEDLLSQEAAQSLINSSESPRAIIVGSRRDRISKQTARSVIGQLQSAYCDAAFGDLVVDKLLVDNNKAGKRKKKEDAGYKQIREKVSNFAMSLVVSTPLAWFAFRQVLQKSSRNKPLLSFSEVVVVAKACDIPEDVVPSVLHFYHQLGALLHYATIPSLKNTVIVEPQWLIEQLRLLLMPEWFGHRPQHLQRYWKWFEEKGVLVEELYQEIWKDCGLEGGPQAIVDLLDHFDLAKKISEWPQHMNDSKGQKYFMPCILKVGPKAYYPKYSCRREAAKLHIVFDTGYVPPGFFVRLVAQMTKEERFGPFLDKEVYRNVILFKGSEIDRVIVSESLKSISVAFFRVAVRKQRQWKFVKSCTWLYNKIIELAKKVLQWMPSVKFQLGFTCNCMGPEHFVFLEPNTNRETTIFCNNDKEFKLSPQHKFWLPSSHLSNEGMPYIDDGPLTNAEIKLVSKEIKSGLQDLVKEMEMEYSLDEAQTARDCDEPGFLVISDFAKGEGGTRYQLAEYLRATRFVVLSRRLMRGELQQEDLQRENSEGVQILPPISPPVPTLTPRSKPTLPLLMGFPSTSAEGGEINIIAKIGANECWLAIQLLNDNDGAKIDAIEKKFAGDPSKVSLEIFKLWLQGQGRVPITWETLVANLKKINLHTLANDIEASLN